MGLVKGAAVLRPYKEAGRRRRFDGEGESLDRIRSCIGNERLASNVHGALEFLKMRAFS